VPDFREYKNPVTGAYMLPCAADVGIDAFSRYKVHPGPMPKNAGSFVNDSLRMGNGARIQESAEAIDVLWQRGNP